MKETNMEHFRSEIEKFLDDSGDFAVMLDGEVNMCGSRMCDHCIFSYHHNVEKEGVSCRRLQVDWLMSEYKPEPVLTAREKRFVEFLQDGWLARDLRYNCFYWFKEKPTKGNDAWYCECSTWLLHSTLLEGLFPFITWEDEEPWSVEELRKLKALEYNPEDVAFKGGAE